MKGLIILLRNFASNALMTLWFRVLIMLLKFTAKHLKFLQQKTV